MQHALVWFRSDLRTSDNPALHHAVSDARGHAGSGGVIAVFIISPGQWREHDWAPVKVDFILRHLRELSASLSRLNIPLLIRTTPRFAGQPRLLLDLARERGCGALYFNEEYEVNEARRDGAVKDLFAGHGLSVRSFTDQCLVTPGELRTGEGRPYTVFTPFKKALYSRLLARGRLVPLPVPKKLPAMPAGITPSPVPARVEGFASSVDAALWPAGEQAAHQRLRRFIEARIRDYKVNRDFPALDATSMLSPWFTAGAITHRQAIAAALEANQGRCDVGDPGLVHWISEVAWREFYRHIIVAFPRVCMGRAFKPLTERIRWNDNEAHFAAWCEGRTGVPIVDAGMRQLLATGWMHNRVRMITAMYLTKDLFIDWRRGERHFMRHLIDGDLASNNGGWQWSASTGTDAAPYFRIFNPITQSRRFDPRGEYIRRYVPELAGLDGGDDGQGPIHDPSSLPALLRSRLDYPEPLVDRAAVKDRVLAAFQAIGTGVGR